MCSKVNIFRLLAVMKPQHSRMILISFFLKKNRGLYRLLSVMKPRHSRMILVSDWYSSFSSFFWKKYLSDDLDL